MILLAIGAVVVLLAIALVVKNMSSGASNAAGSAVTTVTEYVARDLQSHVAANATSQADAAPTTRGTALAGVWVDAAHSWLRYTNTASQTRYAWGPLLTDIAPQALTQTYDPTQNYQVSRAELEYRQPNTASPPELNFAMGDTVQVTGKLANGWYEVVNPMAQVGPSLPGVGYIAPDAFTAAAAATTPSSYQVSACNHTREALSVAVVYLPPGATDWRYVGFYTLAAGACDNDLFTTSDDTYFIYADAPSGTTWGDDNKLCITRPGPYNYDVALNGSCPAGADLVKYARVVNSSMEDTTHTFLPP